MIGCGGLAACSSLGGEKQPQMANTHIHKHTSESPATVSTYRREQGEERESRGWNRKDGKKQKKEKKMTLCLDFFFSSCFSQTGASGLQAAYVSDVRHQNNAVLLVQSVVAHCRNPRNCTILPEKHQQVTFALRLSFFFSACLCLCVFAGRFAGEFARRDPHRFSVFWSSVRL